jgi:tetratricopeptide (TPR) repeat protein
MPRQRRSSLLALAVLCLPAIATAQGVEEVWNNLIARGLRESGAKEYSKAEGTFLQALHEAERFGTDDSRVGSTLTNMGLNYRHEKKSAEAESAFRRALAIIEKTSEDDSQEVAEADFNLASAMVDQGRTAPALPLIQKALNVFESALGGFHQKTGDTLCLLGDAYRSQKSYQEAENPLRRCADIRQANGGVSDLDFAEALHSLALVYMSDGKYALAEPRFTLAEKIREKNLGITSPLLAQTMEDHAVLLKKLGRDPEAARLNAMAAAILKSAKR